MSKRIQFAACVKRQISSCLIFFFFSLSLKFITSPPYGKNNVFFQPGNPICYNLLWSLLALTGTVALTETYIHEELKEKGLWGDPALRGVSGRAYLLNLFFSFSTHGHQCVLLTAKQANNNKRTKGKNKKNTFGAKGTHLGKWPYNISIGCEAEEPTFVLC